MRPVCPKGSRASTSAPRPRSEKHTSQLRSPLFPYTTLFRSGPVSDECFDDLAMTGMCGQHEARLSEGIAGIHIRTASKIRKTHISTPLSPLPLHDALPIWPSER